jgi:predicted nucleic acid-binding protein
VKVCLDNHILIWGIRGISSVGQESMILRAKALLKDLDDENAEVLVPAVVVAEFLTGVPKDQHVELLNVLNRRFQVPPFDVRAAAAAAALFRDFAERTPTLREQLHAELPEISSVKIKADVQILATALARRADLLYTHDRSLIKMAAGLIEVRELPPPPSVQESLRL